MKIEGGRERRQVGYTPKAFTRSVRPNRASRKAGAPLTLVRNHLLSTDMRVLLLLSSLDPLCPYSVLATAEGLLNSLRRYSSMLKGQYLAASSAIRPPIAGAMTCCSISLQEKGVIYSSSVSST